VGLGSQSRNQGRPLHRYHSCKKNYNPSGFPGFRDFVRRTMYISDGPPSRTGQIPDVSRTYPNSVFVLGRGRKNRRKKNENREFCQFSRFHVGFRLDSIRNLLFSPFDILVSTCLICKNAASTCLICDWFEIYAGRSTFFAP